MHRTLGTDSTPHRPFPADPQQPQKTWDSAPRCVLSPNALSTLQQATALPSDDWADYYAAPPQVPEDFHLLPTEWTKAACRTATDVVELAYEHGILQGPDELTDVSIKFFPHVWMNSASFFAVTITWRGVRRLKLTSDLIWLGNLEDTHQARGMDAVMLLLSEVTTQVNVLLDALEDVISHAEDFGRWRAEQEHDCRLRRPRPRWLNFRRSRRYPA
jgi:hypothetical protein